MKLYDIEGQLSLFDESLFSIKAVVTMPKRVLKTFAAWDTENGEVYVAIDEKNTLIVKGYNLDQEKVCSSMDVAKALFNDVKDKIVVAACIDAIMGKKKFKRLDFCSLAA
ncbi:MAG: hypothetical protein J6I68_14355 [Butyrivibrio sp.]|uniref:hypothetical protein n=1 Tax=Butyrivibrio sp. TaxID=28121 RepID=UPI001AFE2E47|nr:hypothetical protein [Butyrivibrio sp.]MBO5620276.1 hypothetical protein [Butyrivibrio sp.]MBP3784423.1 hypothetical protein [Butyrivibrio sp.]